MAATNDKARFYLEQTVPELQEYARKNIFTAAEIKSINAQRSTFEHLANSRDASPALYQRYIAYEASLDALRRKRVRRLAIKQPAHSGQRRVFFLYNRAVKKFAGDLGLWRGYVEYAIACRAHKKVEELFMRCLRLHPTKPELWRWAADWAFDAQGDMKGARGYMQRGVRFCERDWQIWVEYARLEMRYVDKIARRRQILGLDEDDVGKDDENATVDDTMHDGSIQLPSITAEDLESGLVKDTAETTQELKNLSASPILAGAIPLAIFDAAIKQFKNDSKWDELAWRMFDAFADFNQVSCCRTLLEHVLDTMREGKPLSAPTAICSLKLSCVAISSSSPEFPIAFGRGLQDVSAVTGGGSDAVLAENSIVLLVPLDLEPDLDPAIKKIIVASLRKYVKAAGVSKIAEVVEKLRQTKQVIEAEHLLDLGLKHLGEVDELTQLRSVIRT